MTETRAPGIETPTTLAQRLSEIRGEIESCVHCGFCLPTCPTYAELGTEMDSPRGRLYLIRALQESRISPTAQVVEHLDRCLDCRACETACPSGVPYGRILEHTRSALERERRRPARERFLRWIAFRQLLPHRGRLAMARWMLQQIQGPGRSARFFQRGLQTLPASWRRAAAMAPEVRGKPLTEKRALRFDPEEKARETIGFFTGCVMDQTMGDTHRATVRLLTRHGYAVLVPPEQTCCGALHAHNGDSQPARDLILRNARVFREAGVSRIVVNSAGCGAQLREGFHLFAGGAPSPHPRELETSVTGNTGGPSLANPSAPVNESGAAARWLAERTVDFTELLVEAGFRPPTRPLPERVVYDPPCHLQHAQRVTDPPEAILRRIPGVELLPLAESDMCCGAAGIYNLLQPELSSRLGARKIDHILATGASTVVTANPGCLIQIQAGLRARNSLVRVVHLADFLDAAY